MKKFIFIFIILALIGAITAYFHWDRKAFSKGDIKLEILGPRYVELGEEVVFNVRFRNIGYIRLDDPELVFEFPDNVILEPGVSRRQKLGREDLGIAIYPGQERTFHFRARLLGEEGDALTVRTNLNYQPRGLATRFESVTTFTTTIKRFPDAEKAPIVFWFDFPPEIEPEEEFQFQINYFSRIDHPLLDLQIIADYPEDFEFINARPLSLEENNWNTSLDQYEDREINIRGKISGEPGDSKVFRANLGIWKEGEFISLKRIVRRVELVESSLDIIQKINNNENHIIRPGELLRYEILFENITNETLRGLYLTVDLHSEVFNLETLVAPEGNFVRGGNSITWSWRDIGDLRFLAPGEQGRVNFKIQTKPYWDIINPKGEIVVKTTVSMGKDRAEFVNKVNSKLEVCQRVWFNDEVFGNIGPTPPQVGVPTTYTVMWRAKNHHNKVQDIKIRAILPKNVELVEEVYIKTGTEEGIEVGVENIEQKEEKMVWRIHPKKELENFTFNPETREIVWRIEEMEVGKGVLSDLLAPNISFQITFTPDKLQIGTTPNLIGPAEVTGKDLWTEQVLRDIDGAIDTTLPDDPFVTEEMGIIE